MPVWKTTSPPASIGEPKRRPEKVRPDSRAILASSSHSPGQGPPGAGGEDSAGMRASQGPPRAAAERSLVGVRPGGVVVSVNLSGRGIGCRRNRAAHRGERGRRMSSPRRVLLIGLDAAEPSRIEEGSARGELPEIAALLGRGTYGRLGTTAGLLSGSPWPTFYTGSSPGAHGLYHHMQWRSEKARLERPSDRWLPVLPFWRAFPESGPRAVVLDAPMTYPPAPFPGFEIAGWATHDRLGPPASHPEGALADMRRAFGRDLVAEEVHGLQKLGDLRALGASLARASEKVGEAGEALLRREPWDLFFVTFGTLHRAGDKLWDETAVRGAASPEDVESIAAALDGVYAAVDRAVGRLVRAAGDGTAVVLFSLHGMGPNRNRSPLLPEMLR
ncbi:MAG: hypothetical protein EHM19_01630, partial [Candidatus Latescibacterota bacterium]